MALTLKPCGSRIIVRQDKAEETSKGGIVLPENSRKKPGKGVVLIVGKDVEEVEEGDTVMFHRYEATPLEIEGADLVVIPEEHILVRLAQDEELPRCVSSDPT